MEQVGFKFRFLTSDSVLTAVQPCLQTLSGATCALQPDGQRSVEGAVLVSKAVVSTLIFSISPENTSLSSTPCGF